MTLIQLDNQREKPATRSVVYARRGTAGRLDGLDGLEVATRRARADGVTTAQRTMKILKTIARRHHDDQ